jgi:hypothetical protein
VDSNPLLSVSVTVSPGAAAAPFNVTEQDILSELASPGPVHVIPVRVRGVSPGPPHIVPPLAPASITLPDGRAAAAWLNAIDVTLVPATITTWITATAPSSMDTSFKPETIQDTEPAAAE